MLYLYIQLILALLVLPFAAPATVAVGQDPKLFNQKWYLSFMSGRRLIHTDTSRPANKKYVFEFVTYTTTLSFPLRFSGWMNCNGFFAEYALPAANVISMTYRTMTNAECVTQLPFEPKQYGGVLDFEFFTASDRAYSYTVSSLDATKALTELVMYDRSNAPLFVFYNQYVPAYQYTFPLVYR